MIKEINERMKEEKRKMNKEQKKGRDFQFPSVRQVTLNLNGVTKD